MLFVLFFTSGTIAPAMLLWRFITYYSGIIVGSFFAGLEKKKDKMQPSLAAADAVPSTGENAPAPPRQADEADGASAEMLQPDTGEEDS